MEVGTLSLRHYRCVVVAGMREMTVEGTEESHARRDRKELEGYSFPSFSLIDVIREAIEEIEEQIRMYSRKSGEDGPTLCSGYTAWASSGRVLVLHVRDHWTRNIAT